MPSKSNSGNLFDCLRIRSRFVPEGDAFTGVSRELNLKYRFHVLHKAFGKPQGVGSIDIRLEAKSTVTLEACN
jgi:hypothetical protein